MLPLDTQPLTETCARTQVCADGSPVRRLQPLLVRALVLADLGLALFPPWAWWLLLRWTGRALGPRELVHTWAQGVRFSALHIAHSLTHGRSGLGIVLWTAAPTRRASLPEIEDHVPSGSCGSCHNCCQTYWMPAEQRVTCPLRDERGCAVYGGLWWDYFNCGNYPANVRDIEVYRCPRFDGSAVCVPTGRLRTVRS